MKFSLQFNMYNLLLKQKNGNIDILVMLWLQNAACHIFCFFLLMLGNGLTLQNSTVDSGIQDSIRTSMQTLIVNSYDGRISQMLNQIQEEVRAMTDLNHRIVLAVVSQVLLRSVQTCKLTP